MPSSRAAGAAVVVCAVMTVAACSSTESGQPSPAAPSTSGFQGNGTNHITLPPRPRDIPMAGVDPCTLLTAAQQARFQVKAGVRVPVGHEEVGLGCAYNNLNNAGGQGLDIAAITSPGIEHWLNPYLTDTITQVSIAGFPALNVTPVLAQATGCSTNVSVANGQMLEIDNGLDATGMTKAQSCQKTNEVAQAAMATLLSLK